MKIIIILATGSYYTCNPSSSRQHTLIDFVELDDAIHMQNQDDFEPQHMVVDEIYEVDVVILGPQTCPPFKLIPI